MIIQDTEISIESRLIGPLHRPFVIAEIGINHEGSMEKAIRMVDDAVAAGCECVKFQSHVIEDEMIPNDVIPGNADVSIWDIMARCALTAEEEFQLKKYVEDKGSIFLCTPFSRAAADRLEAIDVSAYKIGSGECNNYPLIEHIARFGKPMILSTGMNDLASIERSVQIMRKHSTPFALLHCTSMYPTPYSAVQLGAIAEIREHFSTGVVGLSDHSLGNYTCFGAVALGACILEKHFTSDMTWPGPDVSISIDPGELAQLIEGADAIHQANGGRKEILEGEASTIAFAYASVVTIVPIKAGETLSLKNVWVKRPGTGEILAPEFDTILGRTVVRDISVNHQLEWADIN